MLIGLNDSEDELFRQLPSRAVNNKQANGKVRSSSGGYQRQTGQNKLDPRKSLVDTAQDKQ